MNNILATATLTSLCLLALSACNTPATSVPTAETAASEQPPANTYSNEYFSVEPFSDPELEYTVEIDEWGDYADEQYNDYRTYWFVLDASQDERWLADTFEPFLIHQYPLESWEDKLIVTERGYVENLDWADGLPYMGTFLAKNEDYIYAWQRGHDCPETLCQWFIETDEQIETFQLR